MSTLSGLLVGSFIGNLLTGKATIKTGEDALRRFLMPPHPLTNFEIQKYYQNEPKLNVFDQEIIYLK